MSNIGISILISTYNGAPRLGETLDALAKLNIANIPFVELIIVDNASTDDTYTFSIEKWDRLGTPFPLTCLIEKTPGKINAQELGLTYTKGKYVIICDDDNSLFPDYLEIGYKYLEENPSIGVLGGQGIRANTQEYPEWFDQYSYFYGCAPQALKTGNVKPVRNVVYGAGMWFRFDAYQKTKELGYTFILTGRQGKKLIAGEDSELCWIIRFQNYEIWYIDEMKFYHHITSNRLTEEYRKKLILGMTESGLNGTIHNRIWNGIITKKVHFFWFKEFVYSLLYMLKIPFDSRITDKIFDFKRTKNNILVLLKERGNYDQKVNRILDFKQKCETLQMISK